MKVFFGQCTRCQILIGRMFDTFEKACGEAELHESKTPLHREGDVNIIEGRLERILAHRDRTAEFKGPQVS